MKPQHGLCNEADEVTPMLHNNDNLDDADDADNADTSDCMDTAFTSYSIVCDECGDQSKHEYSFGTSGGWFSCDVCDIVWCPSCKNEPESIRDYVTVTTAVHAKQPYTFRSVADFDFNHRCARIYLGKKKIGSPAEFFEQACVYCKNENEKEVTKLLDDEYIWINDKKTTQEQINAYVAIYNQ
jgi:hypothetical protein